MNEIIRPTLVVDKEICLRNIERMAKKAVENNMHFRPHFKTHQSAKIGEWFREFGVEAITVSSVQMAEYFAAKGWKDITIAFPLNIREINNINRLAASIKLQLLVENTEAAEVLAEKITNPVEVWIKIDTGYNRTGIDASNTNLIESVVKKITHSVKLIFKGFLTHTGHTYDATSTNQIFSRHFDALLKLKSLKNQYKYVLPDVEISMGDTPSATICTNFSDVDEIRPGNFVFYDLMQQDLGVCKFSDIAVKMVCPVVAKHIARNEIIIHGGAVHFSRDEIINIDGKSMFGRIIIQKKGEKIMLDQTNYLARLSQEHGILKVAQNQFKNFNIGDLVEIIPVHSCLTANLMGHYRTTDGALIEMMPKY
ncbi:MAG TPA: alanine racemase [Draconibacterium sp.]|nr:alanine racemase [Draconibacterium sp.]